MSKLLRLIPFAILATPFIAAAHEVYVLPKEMVERAMQTPPLPILQIIDSHTGEFFFWAFITGWAIFTILSISISKPVERMLLPILKPLKQYAPLAGRITLGVAIFASGYIGATFGPELSFMPEDGNTLLFDADMIRYGLMVLGALITIGLFTRAAALLLGLLYIGLWTRYGTYMLTYTNYFGEIVMTLIVGNMSFAVDRYFHHLYPNSLHSLLSWFERHAFLILRIAFGISLIFASVYAKFLHAQLALDTVTMYSLTAYFPFDPPFIVLGAFAVEILLGLFFIFGIEVRFASLFLLFWLTLSLLYFREAVWPHLILAGAAIAIFMHGYDEYTLEWGFMRMRKHGAQEPVF